MSSSVTNFLRIKLPHRGSSAKYSVIDYQGPHHTLIDALLQMLTWDVIDPLGYFRINWDMMIILLLVYIALVIPFVVGFGVLLQAGSPLGTWEHIVDSLFMLDVLLNFRTGIVSKCGERKIIRALDL